MLVTLRSKEGRLADKATTFAENFLNPIDVVRNAAGAFCLTDYGAEAVYRISQPDQRAPEQTKPTLDPLRQAQAAKSPLACRRHAAGVRSPKLDALAERTCGSRAPTRP